MSGKNKFGLFSIILLAMNSIIGSGIFLLPGQAYAIVGTSSLIVYLFVTLLVGSIALCFAEAAGLKVDLCIGHHRTGPKAVHNCRGTRELLCRIAQEEYEQTHTREEWMKIAGKNYL